MKSKQAIVIFSFCLLISLICGFPHLIGWLRFGRSYSPLGMNNADPVTMEETYTYAPRVAAFLKKNQLFIHDPYVYENKDKPSPFIGETFPAYIMVILAKIFGSVPLAFIAADFIFPVIAAILIFYLLLKKTNHFLLSLTGSAVVVFLRDILMLIPYPTSIINYFLFKNTPVELLPITRSFHPEISLPILLLFIVVLNRALESKKRGWMIISGIIFGLLFYTYIFYWTTVSFSLFILFCLFLFKKKKSELKITALIITIGMIIASYYFYNLFLFAKLPEAVSFLQKSTLLRTDFIFIPSVRFLIFFIIVFLFKKKKNYLDLIFLSMILSASLLPDISFHILRRNLEGIHWVRRLLLPISTLYLFSFMPALRKNIHTKLLLSLIIICCIFYAVVVQLRVVKKHDETYLQTPDIELISYLNDNIPKNQVVGSLDNQLNHLLPALTSHYDFLPESIMSISSPTEILGRYFYLSDLCRIEKKVAIDLIKNKYGGTIYYFSWKNNRQKSIEEINSYVNKKIPINFRLNYFVANKQIAPICQINKKKIYNNEKYSIYKIE